MMQDYKHLSPWVILLFPNCSYGITLMEQTWGRYEGQKRNWISLLTIISVKFRVVINLGQFKKKISF